MFCVIMNCSFLSVTHACRATFESIIKCNTIICSQRLDFSKNTLLIIASFYNFLSSSTGHVLKQRATDPKSMRLTRTSIPLNTFISEQPSRNIFRSTYQNLLNYEIFILIANLLRSLIRQFEPRLTPGVGTST